MKTTCHRSGHLWRLRHRCQETTCRYWLLCDRCGSVPKTQTVYVYLTSEEVAKVKALMEQRHVSIGHSIEEMVREALKAREAK